MLETSDTSTAIRFSNVTAGYSKHSSVLIDVTFAFEGPGITRLVGRNGSGKSTAVELISGYLPAQSGQVIVAGMPAHLPAARFARNICRTHIALYPHMSVRDHLILAGRASGVRFEDALTRAENYGLAPWISAAAGSLSTGNRRKLWTIICTLRRVGIVVLDEPYVGLDAQGRKVLNGEILFWSKTALVVVVTHASIAELNVAREICLDDLHG